MDSGYSEYQHRLDEIEYKVNAHYRKAERELQEKIDKFWKDAARLDWQKRHDMENGLITEEDYRQWQRNKIMSGKVWEQRKKVISEDLHNSNVIARQIIGDELPNVYAIGHNFATYQIENSAHVDTFYNLYNHEAVERLIADNPDLLPYQKLNAAKDIRWNKTNIQSVMIQGILQGESIPHLAKRLTKTMYQKNRAFAIRNARTMATGAYNGGKMDAFKRAKSMGIDMKVRWRATFDNRTRDSHRLLDGEVREVGEPFSNGLKFPVDLSKLNDKSMKVADFNLLCRETYNCRCTIQAVSSRLESRAIKYRSNEAVGISYEEWKKGHKATHIKPKEQPKHKPSTKVKADYNDSTKKALIESYTYHQNKNKLNLVPLSEIEYNDKNHPIKVSYGKITDDTQKSFNHTLANLLSEYDTPLQEVRAMTKEEYMFMGGKDVFARVSHNYEVDSAIMQINPIKCKNINELVENLKEKKARNYIPHIKDGTEKDYIITHEFAHTLIDMQSPLNNKRNWANADYKRIKNVRKEIEGVYSEYLEDVRQTEIAYSKFKEAELKAMTTFDQNDWDKAVELRNSIVDVKISTYSMVNSDEFMAECFAHAKLSDKPNKYADRVLEIIDRNFKR